MPRRLDILVPVYDEGAATVKPLLDSIALQRNVDFNEIGVIICCDGGDTIITDEMMSHYPYHMEFHMLEHHGVSATRNACFDYSDSEYVSWADCDDMYCDVCGLSIVFREMDNPPQPQELALAGRTAKDVGVGFDVLISCFREETIGPNGEIVYINRDNDSTFCHGKYYRKQYLIDKNIRWNENLYIHEDSFFQILARECADPLRSRYCPMPFYLWCFRKSSVCRHEPDVYILKTMPNMIASNSAVVDDFIMRGMEDKAAMYFVMHVFDVYYLLNKPEWIEKTNVSYRDKVEHDFVAHFRRHHQLWDEMPSQQKMMISQGVRQRSVMEGMLMEAVTCADWIQQILAKFPEESAT